METVSLEKLRTIALARVRDIEAGEPLDPRARALIRLGLCASVTALDRASLAVAIVAAYDSGATSEQVQEVIALVSGLGVHSLMVSAVQVLESARERELLPDGTALDERRQELWNQHVGDDPYWLDFERELPGFLNAMLVLSPDIFAGFFDYCAIPWKSGTVPARIKELIAMASDATSAHRFAPGFRIHLANAVKLGCGRAAILETLDLAADAPPHRGTS